MTINKLIRRNYPITEAYLGVHTIKPLLLKQPAVVVMDDEIALGILTAKDIVQTTYNLIADCISYKPAVKPNQKIAEVVTMMEETCSDALLVYDNAQMVGIICKDDILKHFQHTVESNQRLLHGIAHDLRNPISSISSINNMLEENIQKEENKELLAYSRQSVNYALELLNGFLESERLPGQLPDLADVDLNELVLSCLEHASLSCAEKEIKIISDFEASSCRGMSNRIQLQRAFSNLINNAIKFTKADGTIKISTIKEQEHLLVSIQDNGIGIPNHLKPVLFDKFTSARRPGTNGENTTGLGLYITQMIIEQHNGSIWVESTEDIGSTFYVALPLMNEDKVF